MSVVVVDYGPRGDRKTGIIVWEGSSEEDAAAFIEAVRVETDSDERFSIDADQVE